MASAEGIRTIIRREDFGALVYDIHQNSILRLTGDEAVSRLNNIASDEVVRGINNPSVGATSLRAPEKIYTDITKICDMGCEHCLSESGVEETETLDRETLDLIGNQMVEMGIFRIKIGGGEPTLHPDFREIVSTLRNKSLGVSMSTNGLVVAHSKDMARFLAEKNVKVSVSLDGGEEAHNRIRRHPKAFVLALKAIAKLKDEGAYVAIGTTLSRGNLSEVENVIQVAERFEVPIKFKRVKPLGRAVANNLLILPGAPGYALAMDLIGKSKWSRLEGILEKSTCQSGDDIDPEFDSCGAGTRSMGINAKGQFSTCFFLGDHFLEGNVREQSIADIWKNGRAFLEIRESVAKGIPECDICQRRRICHGECRAVALHMGGTLNSVDPGCPLKAV